MNHAEVADSVILRAQYLAKEFQIVDFAVCEVSVDGEEARITISQSEIEGRIRGYVYQGYDVAVEIEKLVVTVTAKDG